jgi:hypothetical protein
MPLTFFSIEMNGQLKIKGLRKSIDHEVHVNLPAKGLYGKGNAMRMG